jgi:hypothetical protein
VARKASGANVPVYLSQEALNNHSLILGITGTGKSEMAMHMALWAMQQRDRAVIFSDPHRDAIDQLRAHVPPDRLEDVIDIDCGSLVTIPGYNMLDVSLASPEACVEAVIDTGYSLWGKYWGPRMEVPFRNLLWLAALANLNKNPDDQYTILSLPEIINGQDLREWILENQAPSDNPMTQNVADYFRHEYDTVSRHFQDQIISPVLSKLNSFQSNEVIMRLFGQPRSTINPHRFIQDRKIVFLHTARTKARKASSFITSLLLNLTLRGILAQGDLPAEQRVPSSIFFEESQLAPSVEMLEYVTEVRKFGGCLTMTSQSATALDEAQHDLDGSTRKVSSQLLGNAKILIVFRPTGEDAARISELEFAGEIEPSTLLNLPDHQAVVTTTFGKEVVPPFVVETRKLPDGSGDTRLQILQLREQYATPAEEATGMAHRSRKQAVLDLRTSGVRGAVPADFDGGRYVTGGSHRDEVDLGSLEAHYEALMNLSGGMPLADESSDQSQENRAERGAQPSMKDLVAAQEASIGEFARRADHSDLQAILNELSDSSLEEDEDE